MSPMLLTVPEVALRLGVSRSKVWALIAEGRIESVKLDRSRRVPSEALERFVRELREAPEEVPA